jgi:VWFA-related protein
VKAAWRTFAIFVGGFAFVSILWPPAAATAGAQIKSSTEIVKLDVSVVDQHGSFVSSLTKEDFRVLDNDRERPITFFTAVDAPAQVIVLVETSPAVYLIHAQHLAALYAMVDGLATDDDVALISYSDVPKLLLPLTSDRAEMARAIDQLQYIVGSGDLHFYDSLSTALDWLAPAPGKKTLVLLTTGLDSSAADRWQALENKVRAQDAVIYAVALGGPLRKAGSLEKNAKARKSEAKEDLTDRPDALAAFQEAGRALTALATITGGQAYFPNSPADYASIYREIAAAVRHQYVIGIAPDHDGAFHTLHVELAESKGHLVPSKHSIPEHRVFARQGYLAPSQ